jgi:glycosyltransferase involved in cell wall biosynthesis
MWSVATITPVLNDAQDLTAAVQSIQSQRDVVVDQIVIAVGPSSDESLAVAEGLAAEDPRIKVVSNPSGRTPEALNRAIEATACDVIARVDARSVLPPNYLRDAIETLTATGAGNVGAVQVPVGQTSFERAVALAMTSPFGSGGAAYRSTDTAKPVDTAWLGVFRRDALVEVAGYDETFTRNQDAELNIRLNAADRPVWVDPRLAVSYRPRGSMSGLARQFFQYGWWRCRTVAKHPHSLKLRQMAAPVIVVGATAGTGLAVVWDRRFVAIPLAYCAALLLAAGTADAEGPRERGDMAAALAAMHFGWGAGFLSSAGDQLRQRFRR